MLNPTFINAKSSVIPHLPEHLEPGAHDSLSEDSGCLCPRSDDPVYAGSVPAELVVGKFFGFVKCFVYVILYQIHILDIQGDEVAI